MAKPTRKRSKPQARHCHGWRGQGGRLVVPLFFAWFFWFVWQQVDLRLLYHGGGVVQSFPVFRWNREFFLDLCRFSGGLAEYVSAGLAQCCFVSWAGALVVLFQAILLCAGTDALLRLLAADRWRWLRLAGPMLLLVIFGNYLCGFNPVVNVLIGLTGAVAYLRWRMANPWLRLPVLLVLTGAIYGTAGNGAVVFLLLAVSGEFHSGRWRAALPALLLGGLGTLAAGWLVFGLGLESIGSSLLPLKWHPDPGQRMEQVLVYALFLFLPLACFVLLAGRFVWRSATGKAADAPAVSSPGASVAGWRWGEVILALAGICAVWRWLPDPAIRTILRVDYYASQRQWPEVLAAAQGNRSNCYVLCAVNRALYHTGRLGHELPMPQSAENLLLPVDDQRAHWNKIDLYLDLGSVNMALHHASEAVAFCGEQPFLLRRLALINIVLGNTGTAKIYLRALARTPFHAGWARGYLQQIEQDSSLAQDPEVARLRRLIPARDEFVPMPAEAMLLSLASASPTNRMAAEYLIVYYMLSRNLQGLAANFSRLEVLGGRSVPPLYDEAGVMAAQRVGWELHQLRPSPSTEAAARYEKFIAASKAAGWHLNAPVELLPREFASTYFFYFFSQR